MHAANVFVLSNVTSKQCTRSVERITPVSKCRTALKCSGARHICIERDGKQLGLNRNSCQPPLMEKDQNNTENRCLDISTLFVGLVKPRKHTSVLYLPARQLAQTTKGLQKERSNSLFFLPSFFSFLIDSNIQLSTRSHGSENSFSFHRSIQRSSTMMRLEP